MGSLASKIRPLVAAALLLAGGAGFAVATASPAAACSVSSHCYGKTYGGVSGIDGVDVNISPSCLSTPSGNFVTDETWLVASGGSYWVEVGFLQLGSNLNINGIPGAGRYGFWGDKRPGSQFYGHVLQNNPPLLDLGMEIYRLSSSSFQTYFNGYFGASTGNSMSPSYGQWGSETTSGSAHSYGRWTPIEYEVGSTWHNGVPNPGWQNQSPETFNWTTRYTNFTAGVPC